MSHGAMASEPAEFGSTRNGQVAEPPGEHVSEPAESGRQATSVCSSDAPCHHGRPPADLHCFRAVLFDWDGTLVDSHPINFRALAEACARRGLHLDKQRYGSRIGTSGAEIVAELAAEAGVTVSIDHIVAECIRSIIMSISDLKLYDPVVRLAMALHRHVPLAIASGGARGVVNAGLDATRLRSLFSHVITGEDADRGKPDPELFLLAAQRIGVRPSACLVYEDSPEGVQAAKAAGMQVVDVRCFRHDTTWHGEAQ
jgi:beta-phosphoglucomutase-like phosphatase (HAD superfamily)